MLNYVDPKMIVSIHSRLKAAGACSSRARAYCLDSIHSRLKAAGKVAFNRRWEAVFQYTAA